MSAPIPVYYYEVDYIGDFPYVSKMESAKAPYPPEWEDGELVIPRCSPETGEPLYDDTVYVSEREAWDDLIIKIDDHLKHFNKVRDHIIQKSKECSG
jgi:hypothetical protein